LDDGSLVVVLQPIKNAKLPGASETFSRCQEARERKYRREIDDLGAGERRLRGYNCSETPMRDRKRYDQGNA